MSEAKNLPSWADELRRRYLRGEACQFVVHGNVHDLVLHEGQLLSLGEFLAQVLLAPAKETVVSYNLSSGVRFHKKRGEVAGLEDLLLQRSADKILPALEKLLVATKQAGLVIEYAEMIAPAGDPNFFSEADRQSVVTLHRWSMSPLIERGDNLVILVAENLTELNAKLVSNPRMPTIQIPMPDALARRELIRLIAPGLEASWADRLAEVTGGLKAVQIKAILEPPAAGAEDPAERERFILGLLGNAPEAAERARKLASLTQGLSRDEVRELVAPGAAGAPPPGDGRDQVLRLIYQRKREIIERECYGLIEFVQPTHDFSVVGGMEEVKRELLSVASAIREGRRERCPMGILFTGPMGTGKTFVAEAFAKECGLTAIKLKSFRSKWVGATEANLERILSVIQAIGQVVVIIDEGDRAFGSQDGESDGGTSSRVIARIKEFMSDGRNRGRILFLLMTNRPDKLDVDIKRAGRFDRKIPFLYPQTPEEVESVVAAQLRKHAVSSAIELPRDREAVCAPMVGYSNADIEAVVMLAAEYAQEAPVGLTQFADAVRDYLPSRDVEMLEYMELVAVFEASNRRMLPKKYADLGMEELQQRLAALRAKVGSRR
jgi:ATP-dependent 26S proteasome regulatory subunit